MAIALVVNCGRGLLLTVQGAESGSKGLEAHIDAKCDEDPKLE